MAHGAGRAAEGHRLWREPRAYAARRRGPTQPAAEGLRSPPDWVAWCRVAFHGMIGWHGVGWRSTACRGGSEKRKARRKRAFGGRSRRTCATIDVRGYVDGRLTAADM